MSNMGQISFQKSEQVFLVDFCEPQLNLLAHAQSIELLVGSQCGGHGICGKDRIRLIDPSGEMQQKLSPITTIEQEHLSKAELAQGWRLACQVFPQDSRLRLFFEVLSPY